VTAGGALDVTGNATFGAATYRSTMTASTGAWAITGPVGMLNTLTVGGASTLTGNVTAAGTVAAARYTATYGIAAATATLSGTLEVTGATTLTGAVTSGKLSVTGASTVAGASSCLGGAVDELPVTGFGPGCFVWNTADSTVYVSTQTITEAGDWKALW
jgi:fibronectin-binding autotransporter adhesin